MDKLKKLFVYILLICLDFRRKRLGGCASILVKPFFECKVVMFFVIFLAKKKAQQIAGKIYILHEIHPLFS